MRKMYLAALLAASLLGACGGGGSGDGGGGAGPAPAPAPVPVEPVPKLRFGAQISFGDSLSDIGTYQVGTVKDLGGGKFTINGDNTAIKPALTGLNWTEQMAARLSLPVPCAAQTGLDGNAAFGFSAAVVNHAGCYGYAQGGARVINPVGPNNKMTGSALGALTVPVRTQIANHLAASGGTFKVDDMVLVMAGGNDMLYQLGALNAAATAAGQAAGTAAAEAAGKAAFTNNLSALLAAGATDPADAYLAIRAAMVFAAASPGSTQATVTTKGIGAAAVRPGNSAVASSSVHGPMVSAATSAASVAANLAGTAAGSAVAFDYVTANAPALVSALTTAGAELAALVHNQILAKGARFVTVNNLPDVAATPSGRKQSAQIQALMATMAQAFNAELASALSGHASVLLVDVYALSQDTAANPAAYGLDNVTDTACDLTAPANTLGSSLVCTASNLVAGDVSHYAYADDVHPTPYYYSLLARHVAEKMALKGWL